METVTLRTGVRHSKALVAVTRMCCVELERIQPNALYEAVMLARDAAHVPFGNAGEILRSTSLVDIGGQMNDRTREIIVAMFEGELLDLRMLTPSKFLK